MYIHAEKDDSLSKTLRDRRCFILSVMLFVSALGRWAYLMMARNTMELSPIMHGSPRLRNQTATSPSIVLPTSPIFQPPHEPTNSTSCCLHSVSLDDLMRQYTRKFFQQDRNFREIPDIYQRWLEVSSKLNGSSCFDMHTRLTLQESPQHIDFEQIVNDIRENRTPHIYPFSAEDADKTIPRALFLGDSISRSTFHSLLSRYSNRGVHLSASPGNCQSFARYERDDSLNHWLGPCRWDFVQFNVGMHFHPEQDWQKEYKRGIISVVQKIHQHSPLAKIVIALTTPSPFDSNATYPRNDSSCPNFSLLHKEGFVSKMNDIIRSIVKERKKSMQGVWGINDRYSFMIPKLLKYQQPCDIHYNKDGYVLLADNDWEVLTSALNLTGKD